MSPSPDDFDFHIQTTARGLHVHACANIDTQWADLRDVTLFIVSSRNQADWLWNRLSAKEQSAIESELRGEYNERFYTTHQGQTHFY